jgi:hypothetical protein
MFLVLVAWKEKGLSFKRALRNSPKNSVVNNIFVRKKKTRIRSEAVKEHSLIRETNINLCIMGIVAVRPSTLRTNEGHQSSSEWNEIPTIHWGRVIRVGCDIRSRCTLMEKDSDNEECEFRDDEASTSLSEYVIGRLGRRVGKNLDEQSRKVVDATSTPCINAKLDGTSEREPCGSHVAVRWKR